MGNNNKSLLKSNVSIIEENMNIGRVPKRGVGPYMSRQREQQLIELGLVSPPKRNLKIATI